jgi:DNA replication and repair protein RecF
MRLTHLSLTNFRNFIRLDTELPGGSTLLVGANAQGKTSLLEAIYYLTGATSPHAASDRQLVNFLALREAMPFARLVAEFQRSDRLHRIEIRIVPETGSHLDEARPRKEILINGVRRRLRDLAGGFNAVLFLPQDLGTIEGSPSQRRRHLDSVLSQADSAYAQTASDYGRVLTQRNALLKQLQERNDAATSRNGPARQDDQLPFWDDQLTELGAALMRARGLALAELDRLAMPIHHDLSRGLESLRLEYLPAFDPLPGPEGQIELPHQTRPDRSAIPVARLRDGLHAALVANREEEISRGMTLLGPHRDDFCLRVDGIDLGTYGSRGQCRTAMLALKLAEVQWIRQRTGEWPVLLLDEVLAELDPDRREALLDLVRASEQAILTAADLDMFTPTFRKAATLWRVQAGTLLPHP